MPSSIKQQLDHLIQKRLKQLEKLTAKSTIAKYALQKPYRGIKVAANIAGITSQLLPEEKITNLQYFDPQKMSEAYTFYTNATTRPLSISSLARITDYLATRPNNLQLAAECNELDHIITSGIPELTMFELITRLESMRNEIRKSSAHDKTVETLLTAMDKEIELIKAEASEWQHERNRIAFLDMLLNNKIPDTQKLIAELAMEQNIDNPEVKVMAGKGISLEKVKLDKLTTFQTLAGTPVTVYKTPDNKPVQCMNTPSHNPLSVIMHLFNRDIVKRTFLYFYSIKDHLKADIKTMATRTSAESDVVTVFINPKNPKHARRLARKAWEAHRETGFKPDKIYIMVYGQRVPIRKTKPWEKALFSEKEYQDIEDRANALDEIRRKLEKVTVKSIAPETGAKDLIIPTAVKSSKSPVVLKTTTPVIPQKKLSDSKNPPETVKLRPTPAKDVTAATTGNASRPNIPGQHLLHKSSHTNKNNVPPSEAGLFKIPKLKPTGLTYNERGDLVRTANQQPPDKPVNTAAKPADHDDNTRKTRYTRTASPASKPSTVTQVKSGDMSWKTLALQRRAARLAREAEEATEKAKQTPPVQKSAPGEVSLPGKYPALKKTGQLVNKEWVRNPEPVNVNPKPLVPVSTYKPPVTTNKTPTPVPHTLPKKEKTVEKIINDESNTKPENNVIVTPELETKNTKPSEKPMSYDEILAQGIKRHGQTLQPKKADSDSEEEPDDWDREMEEWKNRKKDETLSNLKSNKIEQKPVVNPQALLTSSTADKMLEQAAIKNRAISQKNRHRQKEDEHELNKSPEHGTKK